MGLSVLLAAGAHLASSAGASVVLTALDPQAASGAAPLSPSPPGTAAALSPEITVVHVFLAALATAVATGLGALPFLLSPSNLVVQWSSAVAAGMMTACSLLLLHEALWDPALPSASTSAASLLPVVPAHAAWVAAGVALGALLVLLSRHHLPDHDVSALLTLRGGSKDSSGEPVAALGGKEARKAVLFLFVMSIHSLAEGVSLGVSWAKSRSLGGFVSASLALHNVPEGLALSLLLVRARASVPVAALWSVVSSLPQPLTAVPAFLFVRQFAQLLPSGMGFAAGAMLCVTVTELLPDACQSRPTSQVLLVTVLVAVLMLFFST